MKINKNRKKAYELTTEPTGIRSSIGVGTHLIQSWFKNDKLNLDCNCGASTAWPENNNISVIYFSKISDASQRFLAVKEKTNMHNALLAQLVEVSDAVTSIQGSGVQFPAVTIHSSPMQAS